MAFPIRSLTVVLLVHPKIVAEILGHSTVRLSLDTYSHVLPTMLQQEAVTKPEAALSGRRKTKGPGA